MSDEPQMKMMKGRTSRLHNRRVFGSLCNRPAGDSINWVFTRLENRKPVKTYIKLSQEALAAMIEIANRLNEEAISEGRT